MISVIVPSYGEPRNQYSQFVPRWWSAVCAMRPAPAEVVVVHTEPEPLGILDLAPKTMEVRSVCIEATHIADFINAGVEAASQPWVSAIGVDDMYTPQALALLPVANAIADIMVWNQEEIGSHVWHAFWCQDEITRSNTLPGSCPFRRELWKRAGGQPRIGWADWGFWIKAAAVGARAFHCGEVGVLFDPGHGHDTWSGKRLDGETRRHRDNEVAAFARGEL